MNNVVRVEDSKYLTGQGGSGGSGGHTIQNDSGTALPQESALQFVGVYSEDDSTNGKTKVNIIREMTKAQMDALSTDAKKGVIHTTDEADNPANPISADDVTYGSETVEDALNTLKGFSLITETDSIAINGVVNVNLSNVDISKVVEFGVMASYNGAFAYASFNTLPVIGSIRFRLYHYINSASFGTVQCLIYLSGSDYYMEIASQVNEAVKVRLYARYI